VLTSIIPKVQVVIKDNVEELAECQNKRDEYQKQGQDLQDQLGKVTGNIECYLILGDFNQCKAKREEDKNQIQTLNTQLTTTQRNDELYMVR
jgi:endonuclease/exonuclease/phosphatase (EEP) superfamily protein YafD